MKYLRRIFSPLILILSIFLLIFLIIKSQFFLNYQINKHLYPYFILSILFIIFSIFSFFVNRIFKEMIIITFFSFLIAVYSFEFYLNYNPKTVNVQKSTESKFNLYKINTGKEYDKRSKDDVYIDFKKTNSKVAVFSAPKNYLDYNLKDNIFPLSGMSNVKTIYCNENGYFAIYKSDKYGFNNPKEAWVSNSIDFLLLGDSFAHGACVNRPFDIASVLRKKYNKKSLNLGYAGNGPLLEYATLREYIKPNVKNIIWFFYEHNDIKNLKNELKNPTLLKYLENLNFSQNLIFRQAEVDKITNILIESKLDEYLKQKDIIVTKNKSKDDIFTAQKKINLRESLTLTKLRNSINYLLPAYLQPGTRENIPLEFEQILKYSIELSKKNNSNFYFVYVPEYYRYSQDFNRLKYKNIKYTQIKKIVNKLGIPFIDLHEDFLAKENDPLKYFPFRSNGHFTIEGYEKITDLIYQSVIIKK